MSRGEKRLRVGKSVRTQEASCPHCGTTLSAATALSETDKERAIRPTPETSVTLCLYCGEWAMFTEAGLRTLTTDEYLEIAHQPEANIARGAYLRMKEEGTLDNMGLTVISERGPDWKPGPSKTSAPQKPSHLLSMHVKKPA
jgi:hypothetical protein